MHSLPRAYLLLQLAAALCLPHIMRAQGGSTAYYQRFAGTYAVDARGVRHSSKDYPKDSPPWLNDLVNGVAPEYSYSDRAAHHQGRGFFVLALDLKTGTVREVRTAQSTGFRTLDASAVSAFRKYRWKPGRWKEIDIPVTFKLEQPHALPPGAVRL